MENCGIAGKNMKLLVGMLLGIVFGVSGVLAFDYFNQSKTKLAFIPTTSTKWLDRSDAQNLCANMDIVSLHNKDDFEAHTISRIYPRAVEVAPIGDRGLLCNVKGFMQTYSKASNTNWEEGFEIYYMVDYSSKTTERITAEQARFIKTSAILEKIASNGEGTGIQVEIPQKIIIADYE